MNKIRQSAKGEECQIRIPGICCFDTETTVLCHQGGAGIALKSSDIHAAYGCFKCHAVVDGAKSEFSKDELKIMFYDAMIRTQLILLEKELIIIK